MAFRFTFRSRSTWPQVRAGLIAIAIGFGMIDGCPLPTPGHVPAWERGFVEPIRVIRDFAETPVVWIRGRLAVTQQWSLYQAPTAKRYRMWIEGFGTPAYAWLPLYLAGDPDHAEDAAVIEHARVWGTWDPTDRPTGEYGSFVKWIGNRLFERHPELAAVRVRMEEIQIGQGAYEPTGKFFWTVERRRGVR